MEPSTIREKIDTDFVTDILVRHIAHMANNQSTLSTHCMPGICPKCLVLCVTTVKS